ncbi:unnamed protein product [Rotaria sordida]|uniref:Uncharacterized protein n=1 Tax=Rotaria sordida TaxID=392033 RepID=A0A818RWS3_9BILA|nr:unnamed protein product [Rotaria sordida]
MCPVDTVSGSSCIFPFNYGGVTYTTCTINGPNNNNYRPQCAISVNSNNTALIWSFCIVPTDAVINYATTRKGGSSNLKDGSIQGGTMIWIYGYRFADNGFSLLPSISNTNIVQLVSDYSISDCEMHNDKVTSTQLTCYTPAMPEGVYQIRVYVNNNLIPLYQYIDINRATFIPSLSYTPIISGIQPQIGTPQTLITISGLFRTACYSRDIDGCAQDNNPLISRIYLGGHLCNVINPVTGNTYANVNDTSLKCNFEGTEVGIFNVSMLVTNEYGRSLVNSNLYRVSATGDLYTFQSYAVISHVTPNQGSTEGGTNLTIYGNYFSDSQQYPLVVKVGSETCTVLSVNQTIIQCKTPAIPTIIQNQYQGGRGLHIFRDLGLIDQVNLSSTNPPYPNNNASQIWTDDALYVSNSSLSETVWLIGFIRVPKSNNFTFILDTNGAAALFLSTNDNPVNKVKICDARNIQSNAIALQNDTNYYLFCVGSRVNGYLRLGIQARIYETTLTAETSSFVLNEIQQIDINSTIVSERQQIVYTTNLTNGTSEVQSLEVDSSTFQIGFRGVYTAIFTGRPTAITIQTALNDLPSIFPLSVSVSATNTLYFITFPIEMGDVPLLACISTSSNIPNITEIIQGISSGSKLFFSLDDQLTNSIDFINTNTTQTNLLTLFNNLFTIRCPPSINNAQITSSIVYLQDYETNCIYDNTPITINAFCGQCSYVGNVLVNGNTRSGNYLCFAYRLLNNYVTSISTSVQILGDTIQTIWQDIPFTTIADHNWHYTCLDIRAKLISQSAITSSISSIIITYAVLNRNIKKGIIIDTVSIRTTLPYGYDNINSYPNVRSLNSSCIFPFYYNEKSYSTCTLNENNLPICADNLNQTYSCFSSAIEGVRRLYPKHQLVYNTLKVQYTPNNSTINVNFRYSDCTNPSLLNAIISRITPASSPVTGTFDLIFNGQTYSSIPVDISTLDLTNRLQSSADFSFLSITRSRDCTGYSYRIEWLTNGGKKTPITIANIDSISPIGTTVTAFVIQSGGILYKPLPGDMTRTYHINPQTEVFVGGYLSKCSSSNTCDFQWSITQTPSVTSIEKNNMTLTIIGTGFSTIASSNEIIIGTEGLCTVTSATTTSLICTIIDAPSGIYTVQVNVVDKGLATGTSNLTVTIPLQITSISPIEGGAGGGYTMTLTGSGFSSTSIVTIDNNLCTDLIMSNFSFITCIVPPTTAISNSEVSVSVTDGSNFIIASTQFTYNVTNTPLITSVNSNVMNITGGQLTINGTNFSTSSVFVFVGTIRAAVISISSTQILAILPSLPPGIYSVKVSTINGYARPLVQIEYRFYIQNISPQIGSLYGGTDVYIQGEGFDDSSVVTFTDDNNNNKPCTIISIQSDQIHCQTTTAISRVIITSDGIDPIYGSGFAWSPQYVTVQQGTIVEWQWNTSTLLSTLAYKVQQVANSYDTEPLPGGFNSGNATSSGSFSYQFQTVDTYYYWSSFIDSSSLISMRGVITVIPAQSQILTVKVTSGTFTAQSCAFPFNYDSINYTSCTTVNDTQEWCSPTFDYTGQRLYCTASASVPASSCNSSSWIDPSSCSQTIPTSNSLQFLFTPCTIGSVTSILPKQGIAGTSITITGTNFSTVLCENHIFIGSSYECPLTNASTIEIVCEIASNSSLNAKTIQDIRVVRDRQGYLSNNGLIQFQFQASISSILPIEGSIYGGTEVIITGDGFIPADTRIIVGSIEYTSMATITYSQIIFTTQISPPEYINQIIPITILIGTNTAVCLLSKTCSFTWAESVTPYLDSVYPTSITGPQLLTLTGRNLAMNDTILPTSIHVTIDGQTCNVTAVSNSTIVCQIGSIQVGVHSIIASIDGIGTVQSSTILTSISSISNVSHTNSSIYGGAILTIDGNGFSSSITNVQVMMGSNRCIIILTTPGQIQCIIPAQGSNPSSVTVHITSNGITFSDIFTMTYSSAITPIITSIYPTYGSTGETLTIIGTNFVDGETSILVGGISCTIINMSTTSITCTIGSSPAGNQSVVGYVTSVGQSNSNIQFQYILQVSNVTPSRGSYGGGQTITILGDGFSGSNVIVTICNQTCQSLFIVSNTQMTCITPSATIASSDTTCNLKVTVGSLTQSMSYIYEANLTAVVTSISPIRGGTGGGTLLTILGENFPTISAVSVSIADISCLVQTISSTMITCLTGSYSETTIQAPVIVNLVNGGNAVGSILYQYIDLWSSPWTWGGDTPPEAGTIVAIESGKTVYFDTITPILKAVIIDNASLIFDDNQDVSLNAEYILVVNGGRLQIGNETNPFQHRAIITMYGHLRSIELPIFGAKVLALRDGIVDMHGKTVTQTWTHLAATVSSGSSRITLRQAVNWSVGSTIVIATTGDYLSQGQSEIRTITAVSDNGYTITLNSPLTYTHLGVTQNVGSTTVEVRAEVGLLSHNVIFQGSSTETWNTSIAACPTGFNPGEFAVQTCFLGRYGEDIGSDQFGATIMVSASTYSFDGIQRAILRLSNIEVYYVGQAFRLGRYPVHFHMNGNMNLSYIKSSSIHQTFNRAINIHASHYVTIENNVIYNIMGGAIFLEDGVETGNVLYGNLVVYVRTSSSLLNEDVTPAAFWVTNPNNIVVNNAVAGGTHFGYWYRMLRTPDGPSFAMYPNYCPYRQSFGRFFNNSVHSVGRFGVWIFPEYSPTIAGNCWNDAPYQAIFDRLTSWKNSRGFEWVMSSSIQIRNAIVFDNADTGLRCVTAINHQATNLPNLRATFYNENKGSSVINSIVIGDSGVSGNPIVPTEGGLIVMWDRGLRVRNVSFINFPSSNTQAIYGPFITGRCMVYCGGWLTKFSQVSFTNVANRGHFRWPYDGLYQDEDGSLSNVSDAIILAPDGLLNTSNACRTTPNFINAITCPSSLGTWIRFAFNKATLGQNGEYLNVYDQFNHYTIVLNLAKRLTHPMGYMMTLLAKNIYLFQFQNANSSVNLSYSGIAYGLEPGDYLIICHKIDYKPDIVYTISSSLVFSQSNTPLNDSTSNNGDWYYNTNTSIFSYIVRNPSSNTVSIDVSISLNIIKCRYPNCESPPQPGLELPATVRPTRALYWSNDSDWSFALEGYGGYGSVKPGNDTNIYIPRGIWLVVNYPLPRIHSLRIDGVLEFEQNIDNTLIVDSILINGGQLIVGWPNKPLTSRVDIIINGSSSINVLLPNDAGSIGPKVIGVLGGLDLHGLKHNVSWTRLATTASSGQNSITLSQPVDWIIGDEIILTTTDTNIEHTERHTIANISIDKTIIITVNPLVYTHIVIHNVFPNGKIFHIASAVGPLTRNIRVINRSPSSELFGFRILITDYAANIWNPVTSDYMYTYYKGYARLSNTQFIGYGQYVDAADEDKREGIHIYNLGNWNSSRPTYIDSCSFDGGYYSAIGVWETHGIPITNNVVYKTYESAIVVTGKNNIIEKNLVSTVYWSGTAQPKLAEFNNNNDGAIMSRDAISVIMRDNLIAGVERLAYRIQGNSCSGTILPDDISNDYSNNEVHSAMSGVSIWPKDKGFQYDLNCILIYGFKTYKAWYYGLYINTARNIIIDSCTVADGNVGIFTLVIGPTAQSHVAGNNSVIILNSMIIGSITPDDCNDTPNATTVNFINSDKAISTVSATSSNGNPGGRSGIVFPFFSRDNLMPRHPWTGIAAYPCIQGLMTITNVILAFYNDICLRRDIAIQVGQHNDDGQHPVVTNLISVYNTSQMNLIFNGRPNLDVVNPSDCVDMDCDGLKKNLLIDTDGTLFGQAASVVSQAEYLWGDQQHGVGDYRIPLVALANLTGHMININISYPYRGISRAPTCINQSSWQMYFCPNTTDYRILIIENMDSDTETRRLSPVAIMSDNGYIDLINGPQDHGWCNGYTCQKRISTFMSIIQSKHHYDIYFSSTTPNHIRFRLLNSDESIVNTLALYYDSLQQIDVYANNIYVSPINRDFSYSYLILTDQSNNITFTSIPGSNYFNRTTRMELFLINGITVIDLKISQLLILNFNLPPQTPSSFFSSNLTVNLAAILGVSPDKIRRVNIISANNNISRIRRQLSTIILTVEIRDDPVEVLSTNSIVETGSISNICSAIINRYQSGELHQAWAENPSTGNTTPIDLSIQEPFNQSSISLSIIHQIELAILPSSCREQSPCGIQPKLIAYDKDGNVIEKLGSNDQPWQIIASVVGDSNITLIGAIANYSNGQTQYTSFGLSAIGNCQVQFAFIQPNNVTSSFMSNINLTANSSSLTITKATLAAKQIDHIYVVSINETFNISVVIVDSQSRFPIENIHWRNMTWSAYISLYNLPEFNSNGTLIKTNTSSIIIDVVKSTIIATNLIIDTVGMYVIKVQLTSSNNEYVFSLISNGILVKKSSTTLDSDSSLPSSNITFIGDYDKFQTSDLLEIKRAIIYNYLIRIRMPITSDIILTKGSVIVLFDVDSDPESLASAVDSIASDPNAISDLTASSININGKTYSTSASSSSSSDENSSSNRTALIITVVVGLVGSAIIIFGVYFGIKAYEKHQQRRRLINESSDQHAFDNAGMQSDENITTEMETRKNNFQLTQRILDAVRISPKNTNQVKPLITDIENTDRPPSSSVSATTLDSVIENSDTRTNASLSAVQLKK